MRRIGFILTFCITMVLGCQDKDDDNKPLQTDDLSKRAEKYLSLKSTQQIYVDENNNEYLSVVFDIDKKSSVYGIFMEKDKKYYISVSGSESYNLEFLLLKSNCDTLFTGEYVMDLHPRKYIAWTSNVTDTFYIEITYMGDINFHSIEFHITLEELSNKFLESNNLKLTCSGDWFIDEDGILGLICHQTNTTKWAKILNDSLYNYEFSYNAFNATGKPDNYVGIACYASSIIFDMENIPASCYKFDIVGPASWRISNWFMETGGGASFIYGNTAQNLKIGVGNCNNVLLKTYGDSISCSVNSQTVTSFRNLHFINNGLFITVEDTKQDTIYFKDIILIK
jgi:hypothetical protein